MFAVGSIARTALAGLSVLVLVAGPGCRSDGGAAGPGRVISAVGGGGTSPSRAAEPFATLEQGSQSGYPAQGSLQLVIRDDAAWQAFWAQHTSNRSPAPPRPAVDFSRDQVLAAIVAGCPTGGYGVEIRSIDRVQPGDGLEARVLESVPDPSLPQPSVITSPFHLVRVARCAGPVRWVLERGLGLETLVRGSISGYRYSDPAFTGDTMIVPDPQGWLWLWTDHASNVSPPPPRPQVDFATSFVLAAFQGLCSSDGYSVTIREAAVEAPSGDLLVTVDLDERGGMLTVMTNPYHFVRATPRLLPSGTVRVRRNLVLAASEIAGGGISGYRYGDPAFAGDRLVFTDDAAWQAFWAQHTALQIPPPPAPAVDFSRESALVALMGYRPTGGYAIAVSSAVRLHTGVVEASVVSSAPAQGSIVTQVITNPFHMVRIPVAGAKVAWR